MKRFFIIIVCLVLNMLFNIGFSQNSKSDNRPNIIVIMTDQHQALGLSCAGNPDLSTPNLDKLAASGIRFTRSYVTSPLCTPSRSSIFTGKLPHTLNIFSNTKGENEMSNENRLAGLGHIMRSSGYDCAYGGKWHAHNPEMVEGNGFKNIAAFGDIGLAEKSIDYLEQQKDKSSPFFLVASFDNPHNICEWARNQPLPYGNIAPVELEKTPHLPSNFKSADNLPEALKFEQDISKRTYPTTNYTEEDWRQYRYAYYRLIEKVDHEIGKILNAVDDLELRNNTVIFFTSDHGDGNAAHGWNQKTALFEETINVPLIISDQREPKTKKAGTVNDQLISIGLDLFPTICDYAGITPPQELNGESFKPIVEGKKGNERDFLVVETKFADFHSYKTMGRSVVGKKFKYVIYSWGKNREQLFDLEADPGEMHNLVDDLSYKKTLNMYRDYLYNWCKETNDDKFLRKLVLSDNSSIKLFDKPY